LIKLIVQVLDDVLRFTRGEFFVTAVAQPLLQRIQRMNESVIAGVDASVIASNAVGVMQALAFGWLTLPGLWSRPSEHLLYHP
jgi:hypothetical protein